MTQLSLATLAASLRQGFGDDIGAAMSGTDLHLQIGPKGAWISPVGALVGESFSGLRRDDVGIDVPGSVVAPAAPALASSL